MLRPLRWSAFIIFLLSQRALAGTVIWTGQAGDNNWCSFNNWTPSVSSPTINDDVTIALTTATAVATPSPCNVIAFNTLTIGSSLVRSSVTIGNSNGGFSVTGGTITVNADSLLKSNTPNQWSINGGLIVNSRGVVSHAGGTTDGQSPVVAKLKLALSGVLTLNGTGKIDVSGAGYNAGAGPGKPAAVSGQPGTGGSYGGRGSAALVTDPNPPYGDPAQPDDLGSGGNGYQGGGEVYITGITIATINGDILANGTDSGCNGCSMGSGGGIFLSAQTLTGTGNIKARGGNSTVSNGYGGGGGRIALVFKDTATFTPTSLTASGGTGATYSPGSAGTIFMKNADTLSSSYTPNGILIVDNNGLSASFSTLMTNTVGLETLAVDQLIIKNLASFEVQLGKTLTIRQDSPSNTLVGLDGTTNGTLYLSGGQGGGGTLAFAGNAASTFTVQNVTVYDNGIVNPPSYLVLGTNAVWSQNFNGTRDLSNVIIRGIGKMTHNGGSTDTATVAKLKLSLNGYLQIDPGGSIDVSGKGYNGGNGPGKPQSYGLYGAGGSYGGRGSGTNITDVGLPYGDPTLPDDLGSGGSSGYAGGGEVYITGITTAIITGDILANGNNGVSNGADPGSGGGIYLSALQIRGSGNVKAQGGSQTVCNGSGAGGGRIALVFKDTASFTPTILLANGGSYCQNGYGSAGTIFMKNIDSLSPSYTPNGVLIIDNNNLSPQLTTLMTKNAGLESLTLDQLIIKNQGSFEVQLGKTLTIRQDSPSNILLGLDGTTNGTLYLSGGQQAGAGTLAFAGNAASTFTVQNVTVYDNGIAGSPDYLVVGANAVWSQNFNGTRSFKNIIIRGAGKMTHNSGSTDATIVAKLKLSLNGYLQIDTGGSIDVSGKGYNGSQGPGKPLGSGTYGTGGSYGGRGSGTNIADVGLPYGDPTLPDHLGSGGSSGYPGGGEVYITGITTAIITGDILANGSNGLSTTANPGSGGGIYLSALQIRGTGNVKAQGGSQTVCNGSGGGGGRIALVFKDTSSFSPASLLANGGSYCQNGYGGAGTIFMKNIDSLSPSYTPNGILIVDNNNLSAAFTTLMSKDFPGLTIDQLVMRNYGILEVQNLKTLTLVGAANFSGIVGGNNPTLTINSGGALSFPSAATITGVTVSNFGSVSAPNASLTLGAGAKWRQETLSQITLSTLTIQDTAKFTHGGEAYRGYYDGCWTTALDANKAKINLVIANSLDVQLGGTISADGNGYCESYGPGKGQGSTYGGGAYGGQGGDYLGPPNTQAGLATYGSVTSPNDWGSGPGSTGYGAGGGNIYISVGSTATINGTISANGISGHPTYSSIGGGGSGGSVWIDAKYLAASNTGKITANGGNPGGAGYACGGGGRIAAYYQVDNFTPAGGIIQAKSGNTSCWTSDPAAGTVYKFQKGVQQYGSLIVDNEGFGYGLNGATSQYGSYQKTTLLPSATGYTFDSVKIQGKAWLQIPSGSSITIASGGSLSGDVNTAGLILSGGQSIGGALDLPPSLTITNLTISNNGIVNAGGTNLTLGTGAKWRQDNLNSVTFSTLTVDNGGKLIHGGEGYRYYYDGCVSNTTPIANQAKLNAIVLNSLDVKGGGSISADGNGYCLANGPTGSRGQSSTAGGGAYGGQGGDHYQSTPAGAQAGLATYGSVTSPNDWGSGSGGLSGNGGAGGGSIFITVLGTATVNGTISADGLNIVPNYNTPTGGGSGGSVWLDVGHLAGAGSISANGSPAPSYGCGGGGRLALYYKTSSFGASGIHAKGGSSCASGSVSYGGAGTIYQIQKGIQQYGSLLVDAEGFSYNGYGQEYGGYQKFTLMPPSTGYIFNTVRVQGQGYLKVPSGDFMTIASGGSLSGDANTSALLLTGGQILGGALNVPAGVVTIANLTISNNGIVDLTNANLTLDTGAKWRQDTTAVLTVSTLTILNNGKFTHGGESYRYYMDGCMGNTTTDANKMKVNLNVLNTLDIQPGGSINADGSGYCPNNGPGTGTSGSSIYAGGGYGGQGGYHASLSYPGGPTYGSITSPSDWGSGPGWYNAYGGSGGGNIYVVVGGTANVNGTISANGTNIIPNGGATGAGGGGSGGSVWLNAKYLSGQGLISANGGDAASYGCGGGGRIALYYSYNNFTPAGGQIHSRSGTVGCWSGSAGYGAPGTIYQFRNGVDAGGSLLVDNEGFSYAGGSYQRYTQLPLTPVPTGYIFDAVRIQGQAYVKLDAGNFITMTGPNLTGDANTSVLTLAGGINGGGTLTLPNGPLTLGNLSVINGGIVNMAGTNLTLAAGAKWRQDVVTTMSVSTLTIEGGVTLTHGPGCWTTTTLDANKSKISLNVANTLEVKIGGSINADGLGFCAGWASVTGSYPTGASAGGAYGGQGGDYNGANTGGLTTYGSITQPVDWGTGSSYYGNGGGVIYVTAGSSIIVNGIISAKGTDNTRAGGAGGSIWLDSKYLSGTGSILANGGDGASYGCGGGGRIALYYDYDNFTPAGGQIHNKSGTNCWSSAYAAPGTIYTRKKSVQNYGTLLADAEGLINTSYLKTVLIPNGADYSFDSVKVQNQTYLEMPTGRTIRVTDKGSVSGLNGLTDYIYLNGGTILSTGTFTISNLYVRLYNSGNPFGSPVTPALVAASGTTLEVRTKDLISMGSMTIQNGANLTHIGGSSDAGGVVAKVNLSLNGSLQVDFGGTINVDAKGYSCGNGTGKPGGSSGASYGGVGATGLTGVGGTPYGSITAPTDLGSGNNSLQCNTGGGAAIFSVTGNAAINGTISANPTTPTANDSGGPSGGSIYINTGGNLSGNTGVIKAEGAAGFNNGGGGSGGRISLVAASTASYKGTISALGGGGPYARAAAGTIFIKSSLTPNGILIADNQGFTSNYRTLLPDPGTYTFDELQALNKANIEIGSGSTLISPATGGSVKGNGTFASQTSILTLNGGWSMLGSLAVAGITVKNAGSIAGGNGSLILNQDGVWTAMNQSTPTVNNLTINPGGVLNHNGPGAIQTAKVAFKANNNITINPGGTVNANGKGYSRQNGPGKGATSGANGGGGGYGGAGGASSGGQLGGTTYYINSDFNPGEWGSGGGGGGGNDQSGGGSIYLSAGNVLQIDGNITADGLNSGGDANAGGGSGGSILLSADTIASNGAFVHANGAVCAGTSGAGGAGRILFNFFNDGFSLNLQKDVSGGSCLTGGGGGAQGTYRATSPSKTTLVNAAGVKQSAFVIAANDIYVRVKDPDKNTDTATQQELYLWVKDLVTLDSVTITAQETGSNTGIFQSTTAIQTSSTAVVLAGNALLSVQDQSTIRALYADSVTPADSSSDDATMVNRVVYVWDGGGITQNWSEKENWDSDDTPKRTSEARFIVPGGSVKNATVDVSTTVTHLIMLGYTGTLTLGANLALVGSAQLSSGTFDMSNSTFSVGGDLTLSSSPAMNFVKGTQRLIFNGGAAQTLKDQHATPNNLGSILVTSSSTLNAQSSFLVDKIEVSTQSFFNLGSAGYTLTIAGSGADTFIASGTVTLNGSGSKVQFNSASPTAIPSLYYYNLTLNGNTSFTTGGIAVSNALDIKQGSLSLGGVSTINGTLILENPGSPVTLNLNGFNFNAIGPIANHGKINLQGGSIKHAATSVKFTDSNGIKSTAYAPGDPIFVTLVDDNKNLDGVAFDSAAAVTVYSANDVETLTLAEIVPLDSGIFRNWLNNTLGLPKSPLPTSAYAGTPCTPNDGTLCMVDGETLLAKYIDDQDSTDNLAQDTALGGNHLYAAPTNLSPGSAAQGTLAGMIKLSLTTDAKSATWNQLIVERVGGADGDVKSMRIYYDSNQNGVFDGSDTLFSNLTTAFTNGVATMTLLTPQTINLTAKTYFVVTEVDPGATPGNNFSVKIASTASFGMTGASVLAALNPSIPFTSGSLVVLTTPHTLTLSPSDIAPQRVYTSQTQAPFLRLFAHTELSVVTLTDILVERLGTATDNSVLNVGLVKDNGDGVFGAGDTTVSDSVSFSQSLATVTMTGGGIAVDAAGTTFYLTLDISPGASAGQTLAVQISSYADIHVASPNGVAPVNFPSSSTLAEIFTSVPNVTPVNAEANAWHQSSQFIFNGHFATQGVIAYKYAWDQLPTHAFTGTEPDWTGGYSTQTATAEAQDWYFHVQSFDVVNAPGGTTDLGPFWFDGTPPSEASFASKSSTGGFLSESQWSDLLSGVTVQIAVQDAVSGLQVSTEAFPAAGDGHDFSAASSAFGVMYSTNAGQSWIDGSWKSVGSIGTAYPRALASYKGKLYGSGCNIGNCVLSVYDGTGWSAPANVDDPNVEGTLAFAVYNGKLYAGASKVAAFDGTNWTLTNGGNAVFAGESVLALAVHNGKLYAGSSLSAKVAVYDGTSWTVLNGGNAILPGQTEVRALASFNGKLYAGTSNNGNALSAKVAVYDGTSWTSTSGNNAIVNPSSAIGNSNVMALATHNGTLYAATGGGFYGYVLAYDGTSWTPLFSDSQVIWSLASFNDRLYAGGDTARVFAYDGASALISVAPGDNVAYLAAHNGRLYTVRNTGAVLELTPVRTTLTGTDGTASAQTLTAKDLNLAPSTNSLTCGGVSPCGATNQVKFTVTDMAGNVKTAGPYAVLVDTAAAVALSTPAFPANAGFVNVQPNFDWRGPSTPTIASLGPGASFRLQVSNNDPGFDPANLVVQISTPAVAASTTVAAVDGVYLSTYSLANATTFYWRVATRTSLGSYSPWSQAYSFVTDFSSPADSAFASISSTGGALTEGQFNNLATGVTVQISVQDLVSGLAVSTGALAFAGDGHDHPERTSGFGVMYSTNAGQSWIDWSTYTTTGFGQTELLSLAAFNGKLYAGTGPGGAVLESSDGANWSGGGGLDFYILSLTVFKGKLYAGTRPNARIFSTSDGSNWNMVLSNTGEGNVESLVEFNGSLYAKTAPSGRIYASPDGANWALVHPSIGGSFNALGVFNGRLYAAANGGLYATSDGINWTPMPGAAGGSGIISLAVFNGKLYAGTYNNATNVYSSSDGVNWSPVLANTGETFVYSMSSFNGKLYAGTRGGAKIFATSDGIDWRQVLSGTGEEIIQSLSPFRGKLYAGTYPNGKLIRITPAPAVLTGFEGTAASQTLSANLDLAPSTNTATCGGISPCGATNQVLFAATDLAGNVRTAGPYAVLVDTNPTVFASLADIAPANVLQGKNAGMISMSLKTFTGATSWTGLVVRQAGTAADSDVSQILIYRDANGNGTFEEATDVVVSLANIKFSLGVATVTFGVAENLTTTPKNYFLVLQADSGAAPGNTFAARLTDRGVFKFTSSYLADKIQAYPFTSGAAPLGDGPNTLTMTPLNLAPATAPPGKANLGLLRITAQTNQGSSQLDKIAFQLTGTGASNDISALLLYRDANADGAFDPATDSLVSSGNDVFTDGTSTLSFISAASATVKSNPSNYFVAINVSGGAQLGKSLGITVTSTASVSLLTMADSVTFPTASLSSNLVLIQQPNILTVSPTDLMPPTAIQGSEYAVLKATLTLDTGSMQITKFTVNRTGVGADSDVSAVRIYRDPIPGGEFNPAIFSLVGSGSFSQGVAAVSVTTQTLVSGATYAYFISFVISPSAVPGHTLGGRIPNNLSIAQTNPVGVVAGPFPINSSTGAVSATFTGLLVSGQDIAPVSLPQGATNQHLLTLSMNTTDYTVSWTGITLTALGTASDSDISKARIYLDMNGDGSLDPSVDTEIASAANPFVSGTAFVNLSQTQSIGSSVKRYLIAVDMAEFADFTKTFGVSVATSAAVLVSAPNYVADSGFPMSSSLTPIAKNPDVLTVIPSSLLATDVIQGQEVGAARVLMTAGHEKATLSQWKITRIGTLADNFIDEVRLYKDANASGSFDASDLLIGSGTFASQSATINLSSAQVVTLATSTYFVNLKINADATVNATIGIAMADNAFFAVDAPDSVSSANLPFQTQQVAVKDLKTPLQPVVSLPGGPYSSSIDSIHFVWTSTVALGTIDSAQYAIGTASGAANVLPWTGISGSKTDVTATGLALANGATYYVSVKTTSSLGFTSAAGYSPGQMVDFTVPCTPTDLEANLTETAVILSWGPSCFGPSGLKGYLVEYQRAESPTAINAKSQSVSSLGLSDLEFGASEIGLAASISTSSLVTSSPFAVTGLSPGTLIFTARAVTGANVLSRPSNSVKIQFGPLPAGGLTGVSSYPNPFDSRKAPAKIVYDLSDPSEVRIEIFNIFGGKVRAISFPAGTTGGEAGTNVVTWDGSDGSGNKVSKGIYLAVITAGAAKTTHKIGVIH